MKKNGSFAKLGRQAKSFRSRSRRSTDVKDYDHNNTNFSLESDDIVGLRFQQPPKKQVTTKTGKKGKSETLVTCNTVSSEKRMEPDPVKVTLEDQEETQEVPPSSAGLRFWKFLIYGNHQFVLHGAQPLMVLIEVPRSRFSGNYINHGCHKRFKQVRHMENCTTTNVQQQQLWMTTTSVPTPDKHMETTDATTQTFP